MLLKLLLNLSQKKNRKVQRSVTQRGFFVAVQLLRRKVYAKKKKNLYTKIVNIWNVTEPLNARQKCTRGLLVREDCVLRVSIVAEGEEEEEHNIC